MLSALLSSVFGNSPYLSRCLIADQGFARLLLQEGPDAAYETALQTVDYGREGIETESINDVMKRLRIAKRGAALSIGMADIASVWPLEKVTAALSDFAVSALRAGCRHLLRTLHDAGELMLPDPDMPEWGSGLIILGMGKLGARELNYSSDVDLIVLYDQDKTPYVGDSDRLQPIFTRLTRRLVRIIGERTAHGYVFRTDLRLRPDPGSTPPAVSVQAAETYYESAGQNWERAAMIKARPVAGDIEAGDAFLDTLRPFMWRRHLDFAAIQDIQSIKQQIDAHRGGSRIVLGGHNIKLGRGGIREIEFFAQTQQLIWGGRESDLRVRTTLRALEALVGAGHVARQTMVELKSAYEFCRRLEHRLQMVNDQQTHSLPENEEGLAKVAAFMGFGTTAAFSSTLLAHLRAVERHYAKLFEDKTDIDVSEPGRLVFAGVDHDPDTLETLSKMGYTDPRRASALIRVWRTHRYRAMRSTRAQDLLAELVPRILNAFAASPNPDSALLRFDSFLAHLPSGIQLFSLFAARPELLDTVTVIMGSAPRLADWLSRYPALFDSVLSRDFLSLEVPDDAGIEAEVADTARQGLVRLFYEREFGIEEMKEELAEAGRQAPYLQDFLDVERRWANDRIFQIGVHMLRGILSPVEAGRPLSNIADACLGVLLPRVAGEFASAHSRLPGGEVAVVAFGKLGSREMTTNSDLDLMFIYDHDRGACESEAAGKCDQYYIRLFRRFIGAITASTAVGKLYEVDMRLRPSGNAGPIASSLRAFVNYQHSDAWTWEHQALTRARVVYAEGDLGERLNAVFESVLRQPRESGMLADEIVRMRDRIRREHAGGNIWSIKHMRGCLLDVEFIAQFLQLLHAAKTPEILAGDPISVFEAAGAHALIDPDTARELVQATRLWRNLQGILRLTVGETFAEEHATPALASVIGRSCGRAVFESLVESMKETAVSTARHFDALLDTSATRQRKQHD